MTMSTHLPIITVQEISGRCQLSDDATPLLDDQVTPQICLDRLVAKGLTQDALAFMACWLPARHAVWWGCLCSWHQGRPKLSEKESAALRATLRWINDPSEETRRAARAAADAAGGAATPIGTLALAASWSGGSMAPPGLPTVAPPPFLTQQLVGAAVLMVISMCPPEQTRALCRQYVSIALDVLHGKVHWMTAS